METIPLSFSYGNLYILRNYHVVLNTTSNKSRKKKIKNEKEDVNSKVQEESG